MAHKFVAKAVVHAPFGVPAVQVKHGSVTKQFVAVDATQVLIPAPRVTTTKPVLQAPGTS
jgi:hypothetical protein